MILAFILFTLKVLASLAFASVALFVALWLVLTVALYLATRRSRKRRKAQQ